MLENATLSIVANGGLNKILQDAVNGFKIQKKNGTIFEDMIYLGSDGEAYFKGKIFGGSININNRFKITSIGEVEMASGTLKSFQSLMATGKGLKVVNGVVVIDGDCEINGNLVLGGNITWNVSDPKTLTALGTANSAYSLADDASVIAQSASGNVKKLANGTYSGGTFISGTSIESPNIYGGQIYGGEFKDLNGMTKLILNPASLSAKNADLNLYSGNNIAFQIYDGIGGNITLKSFNKTFMDTRGDSTYVYGYWNFSNASVDGIVAKFA